MLSLLHAGEGARIDRFTDFLVRATVDADPSFFAMLGQACPDYEARILQLLEDPSSDMSGNWLCLQGEQPIGLLVAYPLAEVKDRQLVSLRHFLKGVENKAAFRQALGAFAARKDPIDMADALYLTRIHVSPTHRGTGVGGFLMSKLLGLQAEGGHAVCTLHVRADNPGAIALYQRHGFTWIDSDSGAAYRAMARR